MNNLQSFAWPPEAESDLRRYAAIGLPNSAIAKLLSADYGRGRLISRNAVIGKRLRLGNVTAAPSHSEQAHKRHGTEAPATPKPKRATTRPAPEPPMQHAIDVDDQAIPIEQRRTLLQLEGHHCRWPIGDAAPFMFCAAVAIEGQPYCAAHCRRAFARPYTMTEMDAARRRAQKRNKFGSVNLSMLVAE